MANDPTYSEWQLPNFSSFLPHLLLGAAILLTLSPFDPAGGLWVAIAATIVTVAFRIWVARRIRVYADRVELGNASLPIEVIGKLTLIEKDAQFAERGSKLDSRAYLLLKGGLPELVRIEIVDKQDPTPYALVSTRRGKELIAAITAAKRTKRSRRR